jgi:hypothetical protein
MYRSGIVMVHTGSYKIIKLIFTKFSIHVLHYNLCLLRFLINYRELAHIQESAALNSGSLDSGMHGLPVV